MNSKPASACVQGEISTTLKVSQQQVGKDLSSLLDNPWIDASPSAEDGDDWPTDFAEGSVGGCPYRRYANFTVYSRARFVKEYADFRSCRQC